jgi:protein BCP1
LINVDFDFFDPNPKVDYDSLKRLLVQLFQADAEFFKLHELADLILSQPLLGSTVKTDGIESDPYAYLSVLNMHIHQVRTRPASFTPLHPHMSRRTMRQLRP